MNEDIVRALNELQVIKKCMQNIATEQEVVEQILDKLEIDIKVKLKIPENLCWM